MELNAAAVVKLCVFVLDLFIIIFNLLTLKNYLPINGDGRTRHVQVKNKSQQTHLAGDFDSTPSPNERRRQHFAYGSPTPKNEVLQNRGYQYGNQYQTAGDKFLLENKDPPRERERRRQRTDHDKYKRSPCDCDFCRGRRTNAGR